MTTVAQFKKSMHSSYLSFVKKAPKSIVFGKSLFQCFSLDCDSDRPLTLCLLLGGGGGFVCEQCDRLLNGPQPVQKAAALVKTEAEHIIRRLGASISDTPRSSIITKHASVVSTGVITANTTGFISTTMSSQTQYRLESFITH